MMNKPAPVPPLPEPAIKEAKFGGYDAYTADQMHSYVADEIDKLRVEVFRLQEEVKYLENRLEDEMYGDKEPKY